MDFNPQVDVSHPPLTGGLIPGSPYGMVSAQALGSSSWMSRTLSMDFWAWDRACFAKLESWEALNQLISPPQAAVPRLHGEGRPGARPTGLRPGEVRRNSLAPFFSRRAPSASGHDPNGLPRPRTLPSALPAQLRQARTARALAPSTYTTTKSGSPEFRQETEEQEGNVGVTSGSPGLPLVTEERGTFPIGTIPDVVRDLSATGETSRLETDSSGGTSSFCVRSLLGNSSRIRAGALPTVIQSEAWILHFS